MPFDFNNDFINNPALQYGLNLLGSRGTANPYATAQQAMQQMQETQAMQQYRQQLGEQAKQKALIEQQQLEMARKQQERQEEFYKAVQPFLGNIFGSQPTAQPSGPPQTAPDIPAESAVIPQTDMPGSQLASTEVGKFGTPKAILDNFIQTESSGNPLAIGPPIPGSKERAQGLGQFRPSTVEFLKKQGFEFNPLDPSPRGQAKTRDAIDFYFQYLLKQTGGDYMKAAALYGGHSKTDPTAYQAKIFNGVDLNQLGQQPAQQAPQQLAQNVANPSLPSMQAGQLGLAAGLAGVKGAQQLMDYAKLTQERNVPAGSYRIGPTGEQTFVPDPYKEKELLRKTPSGAPVPAGMSPEDASAMRRITLENQARFLQEHFTKVENIPAQLMAIREARKAIPNAIPFTGSLGERKLAATKFINNNIVAAFRGMGADIKDIQPDAVANAEVLRSTLFVPILFSLKQLDSAPSEPQQKVMQESLGQITTDPSALPKIMDILEERLKFGMEKHNKMVEQAEAKGVPLATDLRVQMPVEKPLSLDEYLQKYRGKK